MLGLQSHVTSSFCLVPPEAGVAEVNQKSDEDQGNNDAKDIIRIVDCARICWDSHIRGQNTLDSQVSIYKLVIGIEMNEPVIG